MVQRPALLLFLVCAVAVAAGQMDHRFFLNQIIVKYGQDGAISHQGFDELYKNLGLGSPTLDPEDAGTPQSARGTEAAPVRARRRAEVTVASKSEQELAVLMAEHREGEVEGERASASPGCLTSHQLLSVYGYPLSASLSPLNFLHICPAIIYELDQRTCLTPHPHHHHHHASSTTASSSSWLYASVSILLISVAGLMCVSIVPLLQNAFVDHIISFLVALAVGTLLGDAFLHLIPHALETQGGDESENHTASVMKTGLIFLTVTFFFAFEAVLNARHQQKSKKHYTLDKEQNAFMPVSTHHDEKEMMEIGASHTHSHSHSASDGAQSNIALMVIMGDGLHNLTDGLAIGAAFSGGLAPGFATAVAVFTHELPHELGDFAVLIQSGMSINRAVLYNIISSVLSLLGTVVGLTVGNLGNSTQWIYAITAGSFIYIALSNLVPEINKKKPNLTTSLLNLFGIICGGTIMGCIAIFEHDIHNLFS